jgi:hypothetical protein
MSQNQKQSSKGLASLVGNQPLPEEPAFTLIGKNAEAIMASVEGVTNAVAMPERRSTVADMAHRVIRGAVPSQAPACVPAKAQHVSEAQKAADKARQMAKFAPRQTMPLATAPKAQPKAAPKAEPVAAPKVELDLAAIEKDITSVVKPFNFDDTSIEEMVLAGIESRIVTLADLKARAAAAESARKAQAAELNPAMRKWTAWREEMVKANNKEAVAQLDAKLVGAAKVQAEAVERATKLALDAKGLEVEITRLQTTNKDLIARVEARRQAAAAALVAAQEAQALAEKQARQAAINAKAAATRAAKRAAIEAENAERDAYVAQMVAKIEAVNKREADELAAETAVAEKASYLAAYREVVDTLVYATSDRKVFLALYPQFKAYGAKDSKIEARTWQEDRAEIFEAATQLGIATKTLK